MGKRITRNGFVFNQVKAKGPRVIYSGLLWLAQNRNFKPGWVAHKFKEIFGKWPRPTTPVSPEPPESILVEWLGIERKRFKARKKREEAKQGAAILGAFKNAQPFQFSGEGLEPLR